MCAYIYDSVGTTRGQRAIRVVVVVVVVVVVLNWSYIRLFKRLNIGPFELSFFFFLFVPGLMEAINNIIRGHKYK